MGCNASTAAEDPAKPSEKAGSPKKDSLTKKTSATKKIQISDPKILVPAEPPLKPAEVRHDSLVIETGGARGHRCVGDCTEEVAVSSSAEIKLEIIPDFELASEPIV